ncbi:MAG: glycine--tRNA ligase [Phycisphaerae bacterium]|nr:glycine--tRNA ligase [Phycisphaerae bacterium]NNF43838.1 glycine--tRNA ligase [Phycisphaerales bacterium]
MVTTLPSKSMDDIVALCKRRGFIFPASEIYGGLNGFWDYGPLGIELKNNLRDAWWRDMVTCPPLGPDGPLSIVGVDTSIIQNPRVWEASGHVGGFNDPMVDDRETKARYRADQLTIFAIERTDTGERVGPCFASTADAIAASDEELIDPHKKAVASIIRKNDLESAGYRIARIENAIDDPAIRAETIAPGAKERGTLTEPRQFNLMFKTYVGAVQDEESVAFLRPETAQGIFLNFKNVVDTTRVKIPFGIAQIGKAFRNEVTPRNFIFRSREFEQMEMEWFCHPDDARTWYEFWCDARKQWWHSVGLSDEDLHLRSHDADELAHYAKEGAGTFDIEYRFPFTAPGFGELEGVAHRSNFDLGQHQTHARVKLEYFDAERNERYLPHVIEPAAGLSRGVLALLCEAYTPDPERPSKVYMKFHPRVAPIKAAIFPLVNKDGMPEIAERLYRELRTTHPVQLDVKQNIGKRYARMDEAGTPFCFTIDADTLADQTVTVRHRDTLQQERIGLDRVSGFLCEKMGSGI